MFINNGIIAYSAEKNYLSKSVDFIESIEKEDFIICQIKIWFCCGRCFWSESNIW